MPSFEPAPGAIPFEIWASPEPSSVQTGATAYRDQLAETGHALRESDLDLLAGLGVSATRYPVLFERVAAVGPDRLELGWAARRLARLHELRIEPIVTLLHHGNGPAYTNVLDADFPELFARYAAGVARAFPWIDRWTPINEPLTTARFSALYGYWFPGCSDDASFGRFIAHEALAMLLAMEAIAEVNPSARFVVTEDLQSFTALDRSVERYVEHKRERMYLSLELVMGRVRPGHALYRYLTESCGIGPLLERIARHARPPDLVGWNYYPNSERALGRHPDGAIFNDALLEHGPIAALPLLRAAHERIGLPFGLSEVHRSGEEASRVAWLDDRARELEALHREGAPVRMLGAWAAFGLVDWDSLLLLHRGHSEDGIFTFAGPAGTPRDTAVSRAVRALSERARVATCRR